MSDALNNPVFQDADKAREWLERHLWTNGPICGHCGSIDNATPMASRPGLWQCNAKECRKQFTVTVGTLFERSHIPLNKWLMAAFLICSSKKGDLGASDAPHAGHYLQVGMVHDASHS